MRRLPLVAVALVFALPTPGTGAKGFESANVCGSSACRTITDGGTVTVLNGLGRRLPPPPPGPFYRIWLNPLVPPSVRLSPAELQAAQAASMLVYQPSARAVRRGNLDGERTWLKLDPTELRAFRAVSAGLRPLPAERIDDPPALAGVTVGVGAAASYRDVLLSDA